MDVLALLCEACTMRLPGAAPTSTLADHREHRRCDIDERDAPDAAATNAVTDTAAAVLDLWDRLVRLTARVGPQEWSRPTPCPDANVHGLITHVAGVNLTTASSQDTPTALVAGVRAARAAEAARIAALRGAEALRPRAGDPAFQRRVLRAACLDLWVHHYDLATALGTPVDPEEDSAALSEACAYLLEFTPQLVARGCDTAEDGDVRIALQGAVDHDATVTVRDGRGLWSPPHDGAGHTVSGTPGAFVLLLSGRGDPQHWRDVGALAWSGARGEAFVRKARLFG
ncbi:hypothetical protein BH23ACT8_BH23ACT8_25130 [soil metagenome]